jgi:hypothetical protein
MRRASSLRNIYDSPIPTTFLETAFINQPPSLDRIALFDAQLAPFAAKIAPPCLFDGEIALSIVSTSRLAFCNIC